MINGIVYDIEIVKGILGKGEVPIPGIEYCAGWHDYANMGISVIGVYDFVEDRFRVFCKDNWGEFFRLVKARDFRISFNGIGFDDKVIEGSITEEYTISDETGQEVPYKTINGLPKDQSHYDILREIWLCMGLNPDKFYWRTHGGVGLDAMCSANGIGDKTGHGALAPVQWQRGEIGSVIDYCLQDVKLTRDLFLLSQKGPIVNPKGGTLELRKI